jgi:hypothetical protein
LNVLKKVGKLKNNKIFIGGFGGVGSRLLSEIFEKLGIYVAAEHSNEFYDYLNTEFSVQFLKDYHKNDYTELFNLMDVHLRGKTEFAIKHGQLMFIPDELKTYYPGCRIIYMIRNPIDVALKSEYVPHILYGGQQLDILENKIQYYIDESIKACEKADLVIKFEDLCFNLESELTKIKQFIGKPDLPNPDIEIKIPSSIGEGKEYYHLFNIEALGY